MIKLDDNLLDELGLGMLPPDEKKKMLAHIYETLEMRVGMKLAEQMTDAQLDEFEQFINRNDEAGALRWLETNFPRYKEVVAEEFEKLKAEIRQVAPQIVASAAAAQQQMQQPVAPMNPHQPYQQQQTQAYQQVPQQHHQVQPPHQQGHPQHQPPHHPHPQTPQHHATPQYPQPPQYPPQQMPPAAAA
jgi:hypothetical protein